MRIASTSFVMCFNELYLGEEIIFISRAEALLVIRAGTSFMTTDDTRPFASLEPSQCFAATGALIVGLNAGQEEVKTNQNKSLHLEFNLSLFGSFLIHSQNETGFKIHLAAGNIGSK